MKTSYTLKLVLGLCLFLTLKSFAQIEVVIKPGPEEGKDAYVNSWYERNGSTQSFIAAAWTYDGIEGVGRSFIQFNLPELPDSITDFSAHLSLYYDSTSGHVGHGGDNSCKLERVIEDWTETGILWYHQPAVTSENAVILPASTSEDQDYPNIDVTNLVLDMYAHPDSSFGFRLSLLTEEIYRSMILASSDHDDSTLWPSLVISYNNPCDPPHASYSYTNYGNTVQFNPDSIGNVEYWWNFGSGYYSDLESPSLVFTEPGKYNVCLSVTNDCGTDTYCDTIAICNQTASGSFTSESEGNLVHFSPDTQGIKFDLLWDFGDGFLSELDNPTHYFNEAGDYFVCMIAKDLCYQVVYCDSVHIAGPEKKFKSADVINLYPNPTTGLISVTNGTVPAKFLNIRIINFEGTVILNQDHYRLRKTENGYFCDFSGMESGIYTIHVVTDIGIFTQKAVIIATK